jgi:hypothetical protein
MKHPTYTSLALEVLNAAGDFVSTSALLVAVGCTRNQLTAALHSLQGYKAVDCAS